MASERLTRALAEIENETVVSVLRSATAHLVDASLERVAEHIVGLAHAKQAAVIRIEQLSGELERYRARVCRWAEEAMVGRECSEADRALIERLNQENVRILQESSRSVHETPQSMQEIAESSHGTAQSSHRSEESEAQLRFDGILADLDGAIAGGQPC